MFFLRFGLCTETYDGRSNHKEIGIQMTSSDNKALGITDDFSTNLVPLKKQNTSFTNFGLENYSNNMGFTSGKNEVEAIEKQHK